MAAFSKPLILTCVVGGGVLTWAYFYDRYRTSRPDYKTNLVEKRKREVIRKARESDPSFLVDAIEPCSEPMNPQAQQMYMMTHISKGEQLLESGKIKEGAAEIACGLAYMPDQQLQIVLQQLQQGMPMQYIQQIVAFLPRAKSRARQQLISTMTGGKSQDRSSPKQITEVIDEEPEDVDSIDGDSEEIKEDSHELVLEPAVEELKELPEELDTECELDQMDEQILLSEQPEEETDPQLEEVTEPQIEEQPTALELPESARDPMEQTDSLQESGVEIIEEQTPSKPKAHQAAIPEGGDAEMTMEEELD